MRILPNLLAIAWALPAIGGLYFSLYPPGTTDPATRAASRIEIFSLFELTALLVALVAAGLTQFEGHKYGTRRWWIGWTPILGSVVIGAFVALAVALSRTL